MSAARSPSTPPAPLRAEALPRSRLRIVERLRAREHGAVVLDDIVRALDVSNGALGEHFGGELAGSQMRSGALVLTSGEAADLLPERVSYAYLIALLRERIRASSAEPANDRRLADSILETVRVLLVH